jgi:hypothetical protein
MDRFFPAFQPIAGSRNLGCRIPDFRLGLLADRLDRPRIEGRVSGIEPVS